MGWAALIISGLKVALVAFLVLQVKEWIDAGSLDFAGTGLDAILIGSAVLVLNAILMWARS